MTKESSWSVTTFLAKHWSKGFPKTKIIFEERDSFTASPTRDGISIYVVETPGYLGAAFELQADSAFECPETELGERISCNTIK